MASQILIVDDLSCLSRFIAMELQAKGYQVSISNNNVDERSTIRAESPDLILLNWNLRGASGLDICRWFKAVSQQGRAPAVIVIANDESSDYASQQAGAQACLIKPFSIDELSALIEHHLQERNVQQLSRTASRVGATV